MEVGFLSVSKRKMYTVEEDLQFRLDNLSEEDYQRWLRKMLAACATELFQREERENENVPDGMVVTEMVTVVGFEFIENCGCRGGDVRFVLPEGGIPMWKADGLLAAAQRRIDIQQATVDLQISTDRDDDVD